MAYYQAPGVSIAVIDDYQLDLWLAVGLMN